MATVDEIRSEKYVESFIEALLTDERALSHSAGQSYEHFNGFDKIVLLSSQEPGFKLRLHVWWPGMPRNLENVHNHRWNFASAILRGSYKTQIYTFDQSGAQMSHYAYSSPEAHDFYNLTYLGEESLGLCLDEVRSVGFPAKLPLLKFSPRDKNDAAGLTALSRSRTIKKGWHGRCFCSIPA